MLNTLKTQILPPIAIIGLGRSGQSAKDLLLAVGFNPKDIVTFDEKSANADFTNKEDLKSQIHAKTLVVSPGYPLKDSLIEFYKSQGAHITSEINLACYFLTSEKIIGITGSLGKSTTTSLIGAGLKFLDSNAFVGGNLGTPFCEYALNIFQNPQNRAKWIALELSSYQLENSKNLSLDYSIITYLTPNHLERYKDLGDYYQTKWNILDHTKNKMILNERGGDLLSYAKNKSSDKVVWCRPDKMELIKFDLESSVIMGKHNIDNVALAVEFILASGIDVKCIPYIKGFKGLAHRLEVVKITNKEVMFINDSKATTIDSVLTAVDSCLERNAYNKVLLLIGGKDKKLPWLTLKEKLLNPKIESYFFGESGLNIMRSLDMNRPYFKTLKSCLDNLISNVTTQQIVLLSPGGTSHDEFKNFEERGDFFKAWVLENF